MKILYFFELYEGNLIKYYNYLKNKEFDRIRSILKKQFNKHDFTIQFYCINKDNSYLEKNKYGNSIKSISSEYLNIERKSYKKIVDQAFSEIKRFYENLTKPNLPKTKDILDILEGDIKCNLHDYLEKIIFIDSIIKREKPALILLSQSSTHIIKTFINRTKYPIKKILFFRSKLNNLFFKINDVISFFYEIYYKLIFLKKYRVKIKEIHDFKHNDYPLIGICPPSLYLYSAIEPVYKELINQKVNVKVFENRILTIFPFVSKPSFKDFKYQYITYIQVKLFLKIMWKSKKYINMLFRYVDDDFKDSLRYILKKELKLKLIKNIYTIKNIENEIKSFNYKVIVILNEFGPVGKIIYLISKKYNIPVYFTPSVGIPNDGSEITPYLSDMINVEGVIDKEFLVNNGVDDSKIFIRGSPKYELALKREIIKIQNLKDFFSNKTYPLSMDKRKILLTVNPIPIDSNRFLLNNVINVLKKLKNIQFIIKLHPRQGGESIRRLVKEFNYDAIIIKDVNIFDIIKSCDILLTQDSAVILDAMIVGIPLISLDLMNKRLYYSGKYNYNNENYIIKVYNEEELYEKLKLLLNNPMYHNDYKKKLKQNLKSIINYDKNYFPTKMIASDLIKLYNK